MVLTQALNGAGDTTTPMLLNLLCFWGIELPLAWLLTGPFKLGPSGAFVAIAIAFSVFALLGVWVFRLGRWKLHRV
jgi:Na+-driven multidrug efflux pump